MKRFQAETLDRTMKSGQLDLDGKCIANQRTLWSDIDMLLSLSCRWVTDCMLSTAHHEPDLPPDLPAGSSLEMCFILVRYACKCQCRQSLALTIPFRQGKLRNEGQILSKCDKKSGIIPGDSKIHVPAMG